MAIATKTNTTNRTFRADAAKESGYWALRDALVMSTSYEASSHADMRGFRDVTIAFKLASVDYTSIQYLVDGSIDGSTWYEMDVAANSVTLANLSSATAGQFAVTRKLGGMRYVRVRVKRTGGTAVGTLAVIAFGGPGS